MRNGMAVNPIWSTSKFFGCAAYTHIPDYNRKKLDDKAEKLQFAGYSKNPKHKI